MGSGLGEATFWWDRCSREQRRDLHHRAVGRDFAGPVEQALFDQRHQRLPGIEARRALHGRAWRRVDYQHVLGRGDHWDTWPYPLWSEQGRNSNYDQGSGRRAWCAEHTRELGTPHVREHRHGRLRCGNGRGDPGGTGPKHVGPWPARRTRGRGQHDRVSRG